MRRFLTIGIKPDGQVKILQGADVDRADHRAEFRKLVAETKKSKKSEFAEVQVIDLSRGVINRKRYGGLKDDVTGKRTVARTVKHRKRTTARTAGKSTTTFPNRDKSGEVAKSLSDHTIDELVIIAEKEKANLTGLTKKDDIIAEIEDNRKPLAERTIMSLTRLAAHENIDLAGKTVKADIIAAIETARASAGKDEGLFPNKDESDKGPSL